MQKNTPLPWFRPKVLGYGASPASWKGWLATAGFVILMAVVMSILHGVLKWLAASVLAGGFVILAYAKTGAKWHWRS